MRKRSGAVIVNCYEELLDEVQLTQMKHRDQVCWSPLPAPANEDAMSTQADEDEDDSSPDIVSLKVLVMGSRGVGKGALIRRYAENAFDGQYEPTNG